MIDLKIGERFLELGKGKITIEIYNQLLQVGVIRDNFSYSFTLPYTPTNEQILGSVGKVGSTNLHQTDYPCHIFLQNTLWAVGLLIVEEASPDLYFKVKIDFDFGAFSQEIGDKKLRDIYIFSPSLSTQDREQPITTIDTNYNYFKVPIIWFSIFPPPLLIGPSGGFSILRNDVTVAFTEFGYPVFDMEVITQNLVASFNSNPDVNQICKAYYRKESTDVLNRSIDLIPLTSNNNDSWILKRADIDPSGLFPTQVTDYPFTKVDEIAPVVEPEYTHICFPRIRANEFYGTANTDFINFINDNTGAFLNRNAIIWLGTLAPIEPTGYNLYAHCPCLRLFSLITHICKSIGWTWQGDLQDDTILEKLLIYSNYASDQSRQIGMYFFNEHQRKIYFADLVPDMTVKEFFEQIQELFCLYYEFDATQKIVYINFKKTVFSNLPTESLRTRFTPRREVVEKKKNITLRYEEGLGIDSYYPPTSIYVTFQNTETYKIRAGAMPYPPDYLTDCPALWAGKGNSQMFGLGTTNSRNKMHLFFWRGLRTIAGVQRPTAEGINSQGAGSLSWSYLYANYWKGYVNYLLTSKKQEGVIWLELNFVRKALRSLAKKYEYDNLHYLIERITCEIDSENAHIAGAKIELRKLGL